MLGRPVPIFSSEGVPFLGVKFKKDEEKYVTYERAWTSAFEEAAAEYEEAAAQLMTDDERRRGLTPRWFAMRGFDVHLMAVGGPMR